MWMKGKLDRELCVFVCAYYGPGSERQETKKKRGFLELFI